MGRVLLGMVIGVVLVPALVLGWFRFGHPPAAVADLPLPAERMITSVPLEARIDREMPQKAAVEANEDTFVAGARLYRNYCAECHGFHGKPAAIGAHMYPSAPQLWEQHHHEGAASGVIGVSDDPPGETYWKVANGIRLTGMPAFKEVMTETEMWQASVLLANADKPLPPEVLEVVRGEQPAAAGAQSATAAPAPAKKQ
jgi:mono/diheme cytochrome c family protein